MHCILLWLCAFGNEQQEAAGFRVGGVQMQVATGNGAK